MIRRRSFVFGIAAIDDESTLDRIDRSFRCSACLHQISQKGFDSWVVGSVFGVRWESRNCPKQGCRLLDIVYRMNSEGPVQLLVRVRHQVRHRHPGVGFPNQFSRGLDRHLPVYIITTISYGAPNNRNSNIPCTGRVENPPSVLSFLFALLFSPSSSSGRFVPCFSLFVAVAMFQIEFQVGS